MTITEFAEQILCGPTLTDKLTDAASVSPEVSPFKGNIPAYPERPPGLALQSNTGKQRIALPGKKTLENETQIGVLLHFFANHELLALELMALILLRFPAAPLAFQQSIVHTMREEQKHLGLYLQRMQTCGVGFGEVPVNDFFWKCIASVTNLQEFVARMSLTFEQANLDFSLHYMQLFQELGDAETANILHTVYEEEIGHVKNGWSWFLEWKDADVSPWRAYQQALTFPLTPARARGIGFDREGRKKAGLPDDFITEIEIAAHSRGRPPGLYLFHPACEIQLARGAQPLPKSVRQLTTDLEILPMLFAKQDDVVIVEKRPRSSFLAQFVRFGFTLPEFVTARRTEHAFDLTGSELAHRKLGGFFPWGWCSPVAKMFQPLQDNVVSAGDVSDFWREERREIFSKTWSCELLRQLANQNQLDPHWGLDTACIGEACGAVEQMQATIRRLFADGWSQVAIKAAYGSAGQNIIVLRAGEQASNKMKFAERLLQQQGAVVVEPWLDRVLDFSLHFHLPGEDRIVPDGVTRFTTESNGQYRATLIGSFDDGLNDELLRFLHRHPDKQAMKPLKLLFQQLTQFIGESLYWQNYRGPVGVDLLAYRDPRSCMLRLKPIVEINPRFTMGRVGLQLRKQLNIKQAGLWTILRRADIAKAGFENFSAYARFLEAEFPVQFESELNRLSQGVFWTTDPEQAETFCSVLVVSGAALEFLERFR